MPSVESEVYSPGPMLRPQGENPLESTAEAAEKVKRTSTSLLQCQKKRRILRQIRRLPARSVVLAEDETDLLLFPPLRAAWSPRGHPKEVLLCGRNGRRVGCGAMNLRTGPRLLLPREHQRAADFQAFLRMVRHSYRGWHVAMLLDEDPSHTAKGSVRLADEFGIEFLWRPKRAPQLNPMDTLWGQAKDVVRAD
jgi:hypothetical protein